MLPYPKTAGCAKIVRWGDYEDVKEFFRDAESAEELKNVLKNHVRDEFESDVTSSEGKIFVTELLYADSEDLRQDVFDPFYSMYITDRSKTIFDTKIVFEEDEDYPGENLWYKFFVYEDSGTIKCTKKRYHLNEYDGLTKILVTSVDKTRFPFCKFTVFIRKRESDTDWALLVVKYRKFMIYRNKKRMKEAFPRNGSKTTLVEASSGKDILLFALEEKVKVEVEDAEDENRRTLYDLNARCNDLASRGSDPLSHLYAYLWNDARTYVGTRLGKNFPFDFVDFVPDTEYARFLLELPEDAGFEPFPRDLRDKMNRVIANEKTEDEEEEEDIGPVDRLTSCILEDRNELYSVIQEAVRSISLNNEMNVCWKKMSKVLDDFTLTFAVRGWRDGDGGDEEEGDVHLLKEDESNSRVLYGTVNIRRLPKQEFKLFKKEFFSLFSGVETCDAVNYCAKTINKALRKVGFRAIRAPETLDASETVLISLYDDKKREDTERMESLMFLFFFFRLVGGTGEDALSFMENSFQLFKRLGGEIEKENDAKTLEDKAKKYILWTRTFVLSTVRFVFGMGDFDNGRRSKSNDKEGYEERENCRRSLSTVIADFIIADADIFTSISVAKKDSKLQKTIFGRILSRRKQLNLGTDYGESYAPYYDVNYELPLPEKTEKVGRYKRSNVLVGSLLFAYDRLFQTNSCLSAFERLGRDVSDSDNTFASDDKNVLKNVLNRKNELYRIFYFDRLPEVAETGAFRMRRLYVDDKPNTTFSDIDPKTCLVVLRMPPYVPRVLRPFAQNLYGVVVRGNLEDSMYESGENSLVCVLLPERREEEDRDEEFFSRVPIFPFSKPIRIKVNPNLFPVSKDQFVYWCRFPASVPPKDHRRPNSDFFVENVEDLESSKKESMEDSDVFNTRFEFCKPNPFVNRDEDDEDKDEIKEEDEDELNSLWLDFPKDAEVESDEEDGKPVLITRNTGYYYAFRSEKDYVPVPKFLACDARFRIPQTELTRILVVEEEEEEEEDEEQRQDATIRVKIRKGDKSSRFPASPSVPEDVPSLEKEYPILFRKASSDFVGLNLNNSLLIRFHEEIGALNRIKLKSVIKYRKDYEKGLLIYSSKDDFSSQSKTYDALRIDRFPLRVLKSFTKGILSFENIAEVTKDIQSLWKKIFLRKIPSDDGEIGPSCQGRYVLVFEADPFEQTTLDEKACLEMGLFVRSDPVFGEEETMNILLGKEDKFPVSVSFAIRRRMEMTMSNDDLKTNYSLFYGKNATFAFVLDAKVNGVVDYRNGREIDPETLYLYPTFYYPPRIENARRLLPRIGTVTRRDEIKWLLEFVFPGDVASQDTSVDLALYFRGDTIWRYGDPAGKKKDTRKRYGEGENMISELVELSNLCSASGEEELAIILDETRMELEQLKDVLSNEDRRIKEMIWKTFSTDARVMDFFAKTIKPYYGNPVGLPTCFPRLHAMFQVHRFADDRLGSDYLADDVSLNRVRRFLYAEKTEWMKEIFPPKPVMYVDLPEEDNNPQRGTPYEEDYPRIYPLNDPENLVLGVAGITKSLAIKYDEIVSSNVKNVAKKEEDRKAAWREMWETCKKIARYYEVDVESI